MKKRTTYRCSACGATTPRWQGQCPRCNEWNTLAEEAVRTKPSGARAPLPSGPTASPTPLEDVAASPVDGLPTGIRGLDDLLGAGLVEGSALLLGGEPGIGKSTLLLQLAGAMAATGQPVLYVSGEESLPQLRKRAERLGVLGHGLPALATNSLDDALAHLKANPAKLVIIDSVQTMASGAAEGTPGAVNQVRAVTAEAIEAAKTSGGAVVLVGHVTKEGHIAGPKLMEHMVDTVLYLEGDRRQAFRILRVLKNRFGPSDELCVFRMQEDGLATVDDPSTFFLDARDSHQPGNALVMAVDGQRPFAVEVQALVSRSFLSMPRRSALGFDTSRLNLIIAVLEKHLRINLGQADVYAKIGGGLRPADPGLDLGIAAAVCSSFFERALPESAICWGELDLNGRIRPTSTDDLRARQAKRLGYSRITADTLGQFAKVYGPVKE